MSWDDDDGDVLTASQEASLILAEQAALHARAGARSGLAAAARPPPAPAMTTSPLKIAPQAAAAQPVAAADAGQQGACAAAAAAPPAVRRRKLPAALLPNATVPAAAAAAAPAGDEDLPPARFEGGLRYVFTAVEVDWLCRELLQSGTLVVGFDIEWRVTYQTGVAPRPVALVQLCHREPARPGGGGGGGPPQYACALLHIAHSGLTPHLRQLMESETVLKVGVGITGDCHKLQRDFGVAVRHVQCLSEMANARAVQARPGPDAGPPPPAAAPAAAAAAAAAAGDGGGAPRAAAGSSGAAAAAAPALPPLSQKWSLAGLVAAVVGQRLDKSQAVRCSNWEDPRLSAEQQLYAATDAFMSLRAYEVLSEMTVVAPPPPQQQPRQPVPAPAAAAAPVAAGAAGAAGSMEGVADWVPACEVPLARPLQPAKLAALRAVLEGKSALAVAEGKGIKESTVQNYLVEAIGAGMAYSWSSMGVPAAELQRVASVCGELLGQKLALGPAPLPAQQPPAAAQQPPAAPQQPPPHQQPLQQQHKRPPPCSPGSLARAAAAEQCGAAAADAPPEGAPADLSERLSAAGYTIRVLKEQLGLEDVSYGRLRLALAHLTRCNPALP